eukprot:7225022-Prymnesium_polylepis.1
MALPAGWLNLLGATIRPHVVSRIVPTRLHYPLTRVLTAVAAVQHMAEVSQPQQHEHLQLYYFRFTVKVTDALGSELGVESACGRRPMSATGSLCR